MKQESTAAGKRLLDVLDIHYYPEARNASGSHRVTELNSDPDVVAARIQSTRSLWDATYKENSYITNDILFYTPDKNLHLLSRLQSEINTYNPGTGLSISEYNFGGGNHISGAIAQADALGIFGRENLYAANMWNLESQANSTFSRGAFDAFLNYNGAGAHFGDTSLTATTTTLTNTPADDQSSIYAALDSTDPTKLTLVAINKTATTLTAQVSLAGFTQTFTNLLGYQITAASSTPLLFDTRTISGTTLTLTLSPFSIATFALTGPSSVPGDYNADGFVDAADYTVWADHFGQGTPPALAVVPEPNTLVACVPAAALALKRPRRR